MAWSQSFPGGEVMKRSPLRNVPSLRHPGTQQNDGIMRESKLPQQTQVREKDLKLHLRMLWATAQSQKCPRCVINDLQKVESYES